MNSIHTEMHCMLCSSQIGLECVDCSYKHLFCSECITGWINSQGNFVFSCPSCNEPITTHGISTLKPLDDSTLHRSFAYNHQQE